MDVPELPLFARLSPEQKQAIGAELRVGYESGQSLRERAGDSGSSINRVRGLRESTGVELRRRGRPKGAAS